MNDPGCWQLVFLQEVRKLFPGDRTALTASAEPVTPSTLRLAPDNAHRSIIAAYPIVFGNVPRVSPADDDVVHECPCADCFGTMSISLDTPAVGVSSSYVVSEPKILAVIAPNSGYIRENRMCCSPSWTPVTQHSMLNHGNLPTFIPLQARTLLSVG